MATKIMLDAGHGGTDPGAVYEGRQEKDDVLALTLALGEELQALGYDVEYTRTTDTYDSPVQKARIGNASDADFFISLHRNSSPTANQYNGVQTLVYDDSGVKADLARNVNSELEQLGFRNINVSERPNLAVLKRTKMPAALIEVGFINSDVDNALFDQKFDEIVQGIAKGIDDTLSPKVFSECNGSCTGMQQEARDLGVQSQGMENRECSGQGYQLLIGIYRSFAAASQQANALSNAGYDAQIYNDNGLYQVRIGKYEDRDEAHTMCKKMSDKGYSTLVVDCF